ncbi:hypothetical protein GCM10010321_89530 [Streptomyces chartreusis]|nr:hypothetical protein GCM10010321_89530 [Streptomyces chartreusis]
MRESEQVTRKKNSGSRDKKLVRQRAAVESRRQAQEYAGVPADIVKLLESPNILPEWAKFYRAYPTVTAAVEAAHRGETAEVFSSEHEHFLLRVITLDGDPVVEVLLYVPHGTRDALWSGLLHSADRQDTLKRLPVVLPQLLPEDVRFEEVDSVVEAPGPGAQLPRFAYRYRVPAAGLDTWKALWDATRQYMPLQEAVGWYDTRAAENEEAVEILRRHGIPAVSCGACGHAVTNRHPAWPGTWVDFDPDEYGPRCPAWDDSALTAEDDLDNLAIGGPHQVDEAVLSASLTMASNE